jgi:hypothetical protein
VAALAQAFGLVGSLIGLFLVTRGIAPNTIPDVVFHLAVVATLAVGLVAVLVEPHDSMQPQISRNQEAH